MPAAETDRCPATNGSRAVAANQPPTPPSALSVTSAATIGASHGSRHLPRHRLNRLHDPLQARDLLLRNRQQDAERPDDVEHGDHRAGREDRARHRAPRILNLLAHRRRALDAAERERDRRPEDHVLEARARHDRCGVDRRRRSEAAPRRRRRARSAAPSPESSWRCAPTLLSHLPTFRPTTFSVTAMARPA